MNMSFLKRLAKNMLVENRPNRKYGLDTPKVGLLRRAIWQEDREDQINVRCPQCRLFSWRVPREELRDIFYNCVPSHAGPNGEVKCSGSGQPLWISPFAALCFGCKKKQRVSSKGPNHLGNFSFHRNSDGRTCFGSGRKVVGLLRC